MARHACARPCRACPWRRDSHSDDIPGFSLDLAEGLAGTSRSGAIGPDFGSAMFACHDSTENNEIACAGWLAVEGSAHPTVRLMVMRGDLDPSALEPGEGWPELHENFEQVITKLREQAGSD